MRVKELASQLNSDCLPECEIIIEINQDLLNEINEAAKDDNQPFVILKIRGTGERFSFLRKDYDCTLIVSVEEQTK